MLAIEVEFITGRYVATSFDNRDTAEWPPHPARLFSALVATWSDADEPAIDEKKVLEQLETFGAPEMFATEAARRTVVTHFVPVNDASVVRTYDKRVSEMEQAFETLKGPNIKQSVLDRAHRAIAKARDVETYIAVDPKAPVANALALLPSGRMKQGRTYPSVTPNEPKVTFSWPSAVLTPEQRHCLDGILARVSRIGHSSSLVSCRLVDTCNPTWVPTKGGETLLRWVGEGQVEALERAFMQHQASRPRTLPSRGIRYSPVRTEAEPVLLPVKPDIAGGWIAFQFAPDSRRLSPVSAAAVSRAFRAAILSYPGSPHPEVLCGHLADDSPTMDPHVAFVPLPAVGHPNASGLLMGIAMLLPTDPTLADGARGAIGASVAAWNRLHPQNKVITLGRAGRITGDFVDDRSLPTLRPATWASAARTWVSVTPIALSSHPGKLVDAENATSAQAWAAAEANVRAACTHVGLPVPATVSVSRSPLLAGVLPASRFPAFFQFDRRHQRKLARALVHASVTFDEPVSGPLLLGSGRYFGLGLMYPIKNPALS